MMGGSSDTLDSIRELNLSYLVLAQRLLKEDADMGAFRLGLSPEIASIVSALSLSQVVKLASSASLLVAFRMSDRMLLSTFADKGVRADYGMTHAAIMMAAERTEEALLS